jgi:hypothetical protein
VELDREVADLDEMTVFFKNGRTGCLLRLSGGVEQGGWRCPGVGAV